MSRPITSTLVLLFALAAAGCGEDLVTGPSAPDPTQITEPTFSGVLNRNGAATFPFIANTGSISAKISALSPEDAVIGAAMGTWSATTESCQIVLANDNASQGKVLVGSAQASNNYCVRVYDVGKVTDPVAFDVVITHF